MMVINAVIYRR